MKRFLLVFGGVLVLGLLVALLRQGGSALLAPSPTPDFDPRPLPVLPYALRRECAAGRTLGRHGLDHGRDAGSRLLTVVDRPRRSMLYSACYSIYVERI